MPIDKFIQHRYKCNFYIIVSYIGDLPSLDPDVTDISEEERIKLFPDYYKKREAGMKVSKWHYPPRHKCRHVIAMMHTPEGCSAWANKKYYPTLADGTKSQFMMIS